MSERAGAGLSVTRIGVAVVMIAVAVSVACPLNDAVQDHPFGIDAALLQALYAD